MMNVVEIWCSAGRRDSVGESVLDVMRGKADVVWLHDFSDEETCKKIAYSFYMKGAANPRKDNVPGIMVGESHYFKKPSDYYVKCQASREAVLSLFEDGNPIQELYSLVSDYGRMVVRPAYWGGRRPCLHALFHGWKIRSQNSY